jgi:hypothetical protein
MHRDDLPVWTRSLLLTGCRGIRGHEKLGL